MSVRLERTAEIAAVYGARLRSLRLPGIAVWVDAAEGPTVFAVRVLPSKRRITDRAIARFHEVPRGEAISNGVSDLVVDLCAHVATRSAAEAAVAGLLIATLDDTGRITVDHPATGRRIAGGKDAGDPAPYGILEFNAPELFVPGFSAMTSNLASNGVSSILIDVDQGTVVYQGKGGPLDEAKREATAPVVGIARNFALQMIISARLVCGTGAVPYEYGECLILFDVESGRATLSKKGGPDEGYEIPSMSTALDPSGLPPTAKLFADIAHNAVICRDLDAYEKASREFSLATGLSPQSLMRYASWIQICEPPAPQ